MLPFSNLGGKDKIYLYTLVNCPSLFTTHGTITQNGTPVQIYENFNNQTNEITIKQSGYYHIFSRGITNQYGYGADYSIYVNNAIKYSVSYEPYADWTNNETDLYLNAGDKVQIKSVLTGYSHAAAVYFIMYSK